MAYSYNYGPPVGRSSRRFDEYFRCYPVVMLNGPDRSPANFGGKVFLPPSALQKLTMLHITYPMLFQLHHQDKSTHAGVLEFTAEEGRIYLPQWMMVRLHCDVGDLIQIKSTDLPPGALIKIKPQSVDFLDISDPRAVLENAFRSFSCLTKGDVFQFSYNDQTYDMAVEDVKPDNEANAIVTMETDLKVEFAEPVGYKEPERQSGASTPASGAGRPKGGPMRFRGTMAASINYSSIAPGSDEISAGARAASSNFATQGHQLKKSNKAPTPKPSTPVAGASANTQLPTARTAGPQPLRLPEGKLFFGYDIKPLKQKGEEEELGKSEKKLVFTGQGQTLRAKKKPAAGGSGTQTPDTEGRKK
jgi:ubiquitin fusion degradation protein 1